MKKKTMIAYTLAVLMVGALIGGGATSWAMTQAARVAFGAYQVGMYYESEDRVIVQVYSPKQTKAVNLIGGNRAEILLK